MLAIGSSTGSSTRVASIWRNAVIAELTPMLQAQIAHAKGLSYLVVRDTKTGKVLRVTEMMAKAKLGQDEERTSPRL